jgi:hypothetical protein
LGHNGSRSAHFTGFKIGQKADRPFRQVAGPELSPTALRLAALPLDPELAARLKRVNDISEDLKRRRQASARKAIIKRHHPPVNVLGGYAFPRAPVIDLSPISDPGTVRSKWKPTSKDAAPSIPDFLVRRHQQPTSVNFQECMDERKHQ